MARADDKGKARDGFTYTATLPSDLNQTFRNSLTKALESYYAPLEEIPQNLSDLLSRLDKQEK
jgi:hypothetical protein